MTPAPLTELQIEVMLAIDILVDHGVSATPGALRRRLDRDVPRGTLLALRRRGLITETSPYKLTEAGKVEVRKHWPS